ncbi:MAG TPA: hypothetical protein VMH87_11720 [Pseudomonadales bacterium]|nr:hypothetical protein [Pseudomonadales bacterium]
MKRFLFPLLILVVSGCAGIKTVAINKSEPHPAIPVKDVQLALAVPANAVLVADLFSESCDSGQEVDAAQADLKVKAASLGANLLVIEGSNLYLDFTPADGRFRVEAKAYFVPPMENEK